MERDKNRESQQLMKLFANYLSKFLPPNMNYVSYIKIKYKILVT